MIEAATMHPRTPCVQQPSTKLVPNTKPLARAGSNKDLSRSGHLTLQLSHRSRHLRALAVSAHGARSLQGISGQNINLQDAKLRADKFFEVEMSVHESELDQYGVVNHAIYCVYMEKAREELIAGLGISAASVVCTGNAMALSEMNLKYFAPLRRGARFAVRVRVVQIKGARILLEHFIETLPDRELVSEATATAVCLNKDYRPTRVFPEMSSKLQQFFSSQDGNIKRQELT